MKKEKERKLGLLRGLIICELLLLKKDPPKGISNAINKANNILWLYKEHYLIQNQPLPKHAKGGLAIVGNSNKPEVILKK